MAPASGISSEAEDDEGGRVKGGSAAAKKNLMLISFLGGGDSHETLRDQNVDKTNGVKN